VLFYLSTDGIFLKARNLSNLFRQMTIVSFLAIGMVPVIVTGNIDLSVGSAVGLVSAIAAYLQSILFPPVLAKILPSLGIEASGMIITLITICCALLVGLIIGIWQGALIAYLRIPGFIVTLGGMLIFRGGVLGVTQGKTIVPIEDSFRLIAQGYLPKNMGNILAAVVVILIFFGILRNRNQKKRIRFYPAATCLRFTESGDIFDPCCSFCDYHESVSGDSEPSAIDGRCCADFYVPDNKYQIWPVCLRAGR
jgi:D-xylose transport system permease protein